MSKKKDKRNPALVRIEMFFFGGVLHPVHEEPREAIELVKMASRSHSKTKPESIWKFPKYI